MKQCESRCGEIFLKSKAKIMKWEYQVVRAIRSRTSNPRSTNSEAKVEATSGVRCRRVQKGFSWTGYAGFHGGWRSGVGRAYEARHRRLEFVRRGALMRYEHHDFCGHAAPQL
jgi:hypothetical protein